jgi:hypothetical protein
VGVAERRVGDGLVVGVGKGLDEGVIGVDWVMLPVDVGVPVGSDIDTEAEEARVEVRVTEGVMFDGVWNALMEVELEPVVVYEGGEAETDIVDELVTVSDILDDEVPFDRDKVGDMVALLSEISMDVDADSENVLEDVMRLDGVVTADSVAVCERVVEGDRYEFVNVLVAGWLAVCVADALVVGVAVEGVAVAARVVVDVMACVRVMEWVSVAVDVAVRSLQFTPL